MKPVVALLPLLFFASYAEAAPRVTVTIKPLHSLVAAVMEGAGDPPLLLVRGKASPHTFQLRPSQMQALQGADLVFAIGAGLEPFMERALTALPRGAEYISMAEQEGIHLLPLRTGGQFKAHKHVPVTDGAPVHAQEPSWHKELGAAERQALLDHTPADAGDYTADRPETAYAGDYTTGAPDTGDYTSGRAARQPVYRQHVPPPLPRLEDEPQEPEEEYEDASYEGDLVDAHIWLDPMNAVAMVDIIAFNLAEADAPNARLYRENAAALKERIMARDQSIRARLQPLAGRRFLVFHDAYQYFERAFGLNAAGSVTLAPDQAPGAGHLARLRKLEAVCVFAEPQFDDRWVMKLARETGMRIGKLDPEGAGLTDGPQLYLLLLDQLAGSFEECLR